MFAALVPVCASSGPTPEAIAALSCTAEMSREAAHGGAARATRSPKPRSKPCHPASVWAVHGANDVRADVRNTDMFVHYLRNERQSAAAQDSAGGGAVYPEGEGPGVQYTRYEKSPPLGGDWEGHGSDSLIFVDADFWTWAAAQECAGCTGWLKGQDSH